MEGYFRGKNVSVDEYVNERRELNASPLDGFIVARVINQFEIRLTVALSWQSHERLLGRGVPMRPRTAASQSLRNCLQLHAAFRRPTSPAMDIKICR